MSKENLRMQMLAGIITEGEYNNKLQDGDKVPYKELVKKWMVFKKDWPQDIQDKISLNYDQGTAQIYVYYEKNMKPYINLDKLNNFAEENGYVRYSTLHKPVYQPGLSRYSQEFYKDIFK
jgi:hypothetical protein